MLEAMREFIGDFTPNPNKQYGHDLLAAISPLISFLAQCRQLSDSMGNAIKYVAHLVRTPSIGDTVGFLLRDTRFQISEKGNFRAAT